LFRARFPKRTSSGLSERSRIHPLHKLGAARVGLDLMRDACKRITDEVRTLENPHLFPEFVAAGVDGERLTGVEGQQSAGFAIRSITASNALKPGRR